MASVLRGTSHSPEAGPRRRDRDLFGILLALYALILYPTTLTRVGYRLYVIGDVAVVRLGAGKSSTCTGEPVVKAATVE